MSNQDRQLDENKLIAQRRDKLRMLREQGIAFPNDFRRNVVAGELHAEYDDADATELESRGLQVKVAGRLMSRRIMGRTTFTKVTMTATGLPGRPTKGTWPT